MILEGVVTTLGPDGAMNIAPMGPVVPDSYPSTELASFELRPFCSSRTYANLLHHGEGVLHVTDDVLLLAQAAIGPVEPQPDLFPAVAVQGRVLAGAARAYEFRVRQRHDDPPRARIEVTVVHTHRLRDFFGFNRAQFAVLEAAILATRVHLLPRADILADLNRLRPLVSKTGGAREHQALALLDAFIQAASPGAMPQKP